MSSEINPRFRGFEQGSHVTIIAEAGTAHRGSLHTAKELIAAAREAGADAVKFQAVIADEIVHPEVGCIELPGGSTDIYSEFKNLERPPEFYGKLKELTEAEGLSFLCTPFGAKSAEMLLDMDIEWIKIASPELNHYPLLDRVMEKPLILSSGVSTLADIEESLSYLKSPIALLHCISAYPAPEEEYNLRLIPLLSNLFGVPVGVSDHSRGSVLVPALSTAVGAVIIEKHLTLSTSAGGLDDPLSLKPPEFAEMVRAIRQSEGKGVDEVSGIIEGFLGRREAGKIESILGTGVKRLAPGEEAFYGGTKRSLVALRNIEKGERLHEDNAALLRSEQGHTPGLPPRFYRQVMGSKLTSPAEAAEGIRWSHLLL
ncbi:MAG: N-acetylneuraminate synthase family protein [Spirochaetia bacterium]